MSQIITSKLNQLQIQIMHIHYAVIRPCVYVKVCTLRLCLGFFSYRACTVRHLPRLSCLCRLPLSWLWLQRAPCYWVLWQGFVSSAVNLLGVANISQQHHECLATMALILRRDSMLGIINKQNLNDCDIYSMNVSWWEWHFLL